MKDSLQFVSANGLVIISLSQSAKEENPNNKPLIIDKNINNTDNMALSDMVKIRAGNIGVEIT